METLTESLVRDCEENPVKSRHHEWTGSEQGQYDSLHHRGRTLYDNLRTKYNVSHRVAFSIALDKHGKKKVL
jgi:hypothetical protein